MLTFGWPDFIENGLGSNDQVNGCVFFVLFLTEIIMGIFCGM